jgi:uncharacterized protein (TIGR00269 family)
MDYVNTEQLDDESFIAAFEQRVRDTIRDFGLIDRQEKIFVAASGGKDSTVLLYVLKKFGYDVEAITINAHIGCYSDASLDNLKKFCTKENIVLHEVSLQKEFGYKLCHILALMEEKGFNKTSCSICGTLRRYLLNKYGKKLGATILLTGHNIDDETEGMLMALSRGDVQLISRSGPLVTSTSETFVRRAKPLYFVFEDEVERYSKVKQFDVHYGWCPCSVKASRRFYAELEITSEKKFNLAQNVVSQIAQLRQIYKSTTEVNHCSVCEQPTSHNICQTCTILATIQDPGVKKLNLDTTIAKFEAQHNTCEVPLISIK